LANYKNWFGVVNLLPIMHGMDNIKGTNTLLACNVPQKSHLIYFVLLSITRQQKSGPLWNPLNKSKAWRQRCRSRYRAKNVTPHVPTQRTTCRHHQPICHRHHTSDPTSCMFAVFCNWQVKPLFTAAAWIIAFLKFTKGSNLPRYDTVLTGKRLPVFRKIFLPPFSG
jgi:hypothetical protein